MHKSTERSELTSYQRSNVCRSELLRALPSRCTDVGIIREEGPIILHHKRHMWSRMVCLVTCMMGVVINTRFSVMLPMLLVVLVALVVLVVLGMLGMLVMLRGVVLVML